MLWSTALTLASDPEIRISDCSFLILGLDITFAK